MMTPKERADMTDPSSTSTTCVVDYPAKGLRRKPFRALKGVSLDIRAGETVGLVGESGSGKTTLGRAVLGLAPVTGGSDHVRRPRSARCTGASAGTLSQPRSRSSSRTPTRR